MVPSTKFKVLTADMPKLWHEADVDRPTIQFSHNKEDIFMRDEVSGRRQTVERKEPGGAHTYV